MKKAVIVLLQFIIMSFLTFGEIIFFYKTVLVYVLTHAYDSSTLWTGIVLCSLMIMLINAAAVLWLNRRTKLPLNRDAVVLLSAAGASGLCWVYGLLFNPHTIWDSIDYHREIDNIVLVVFSFGVVFWSLIGSFVLYITKKQKNRNAEKTKT